MSKTAEEAEAFLDAKVKALEEFKTKLAYEYLDKMEKERIYIFTKDLLDKLIPYILADKLEEYQLRNLQGHIATARAARAEKEIK